MRGKAGLVVGLAIGYVLGTRAGRERYEQIKAQVRRLWETQPVQDQVDKAKEYAKSAALALPVALWNGAVKVTRAAQSQGTPGQRLDAAMAAGQGSADDIAEAAETSADAIGIPTAGADKTAITASAKTAATAKTAADRAAKKPAGDGK